MILPLQCVDYYEICIMSLWFYKHIVYVTFGIGMAASRHSPWDCFLDVRCSGDKCPHHVFFTNFIISALFHHDNYTIIGMFMPMAIPFEPRI